MTSTDNAGPLEPEPRRAVRELLDTAQHVDTDTRGASRREASENAATVSIVDDLLREGPSARPESTRGAGAGRRTELDVGDVLGAWRLVERLASGGMGTVFVAERADRLYQQCVAIKLLHGSPDPATARRMADERQTLAQLRHPGIARLYDGGTTPGGHPYLVMEYVEGVALDRFCRDNALPLRARLDLFLRICDAVDAAHRKLVVHCDLKPGNVLVQASGEPMLLDFGISRVLGAAPDTSADYCTPAYASPELLSGGAIGTASDVFSLGVLLTELLTGSRPVRDRNIADAPVPAPSALDRAVAPPWRRRLRGDLDAIATRACAVDPEQRYPSVAALAEDLRRHLAHVPVLARRPTLRYRLARLLRRRWPAALAATAVLALSTAFVIRLGDERDRARRAAETAEQVSRLLLDAFAAADPKRGDGREPTAREVLDAGATRITTASVGDPEVAARLREQLGLAYHNLGLPQRAKPLLDASIDGYLRPGVDRPLDAARVLSELAVMHANNDEPDAAVAAARRSLALREHAEAPPAEIADSLNSLGLALTESEPDEAYTQLSRSLALRRVHVGEPSVDVAATLHNLGRLERHRGDFVAAESFYRRSLAQKRALGATADGSFAISLAGLAMSLREQGRLAEAARIQHEQLGHARRLYRDGTHLADAHNELANTLHDLGEWSQARVHYEQAMRISAAAMGEDSVDYAINLNNRASLDEDRGALAAAEQDFRRSLAIRVARQGNESEKALAARFNLARIVLRQKRIGEAGALIEPAWAIWTRTMPGTNPRTVSHRSLRAEWLVASGRIPQAEVELAALEAQGAKLPAKRRAWLHELRARIAEKRGDAAAALAARSRALAVMAGELGADHAETAKMRIGYAQSLQATGALAAADRELARAAGALLPRLHPEAPLRAQIDALRARMATASG